MKSALLATLSFTLLALLTPALALDSGHTTDTLEQIKTSLDNHKAVLVDVREQVEWDRGHLDGAILLPLSTIQKWQSGELDAATREHYMRTLPADLVLYCHCAAGGRAILAGEILNNLGFQVRPVRQGYKQFLEAGFKPAPAAPR